MKSRIVSTTDPMKTPKTDYRALLVNTSHYSAKQTKINSGVRYLEMDMEIQKESEDIVSAKSVLVFNGGSFYVVVQDGANYVVAKYSQSLDLELKSKVPVDPATPITVGSNGVCVTAKDGTMQVLRLSDLTAVVGEVSIKSRRRK